MEQVPTPLTSQCQIHAGQPFTSVCQRCGTYMCSFCTEGGRFDVCGDCRARGASVAFPFNRDSYTVGGLFDHAWKAYKRNWLNISIALVLGFAAMFAASAALSLIGMLFGDSPMAQGVFSLLSLPVQFALQGAFTLGMVNVGLIAARGEQVEISHMFSALDRIVGWFVQALILSMLFTPVLLLLGGFALLFVGTGVFSGEQPDPSRIALGVFVPVLLLVPVIVYVGPGIGFGNIEIIAQRVGAWAGLQNSWRLADGHRGKIILTHLLGFTLMLAGLLACGIGALFSFGLISVLTASLYLALRNGATDLRT